MSHVKNRTIYFDLLRIISAFSVVILHCAAQFWYDGPLDSTEWKFSNAYDAIFRFGVPIFVMISGAIFLNPQRELPIKKLYLHNILRLLIIYVIWSCLYGLYDARVFDFSQVGIKEVLMEMLYGRYHLWFLPMIIGIYMLVPILRVWIQNAPQKNIEYFLLLFFFGHIVKTTVGILGWNSHVLQQFLGLINLEMVSGYLGYFVLGYYMAHIGLPRTWNKWILIGCPISAVLNVLASNYQSVQIGRPSSAIYDSFGVFTFCIVLGVFILFKDYVPTIKEKSAAAKVIQELSADTLGVYMMHLLVIEFAQTIGIHSRTLSGIVGIPMLSVLVFFICMVLAMLLRRIPYIGKHIC